MGASKEKILAANGGSSMEPLNDLVVDGYSPIF